MIRVIKRYESRKLYDPEESRYVGLEDVAGWVREGQEIRVVDNATSEEVTAQVLTQIILEEGKRGTSRVSTELLHQLVREGRRAVSSGVGQVQGKLGRLVTASVDRLPPVRRVREEMSRLRDRLAELEKMLEALETEETPAPPAIAVDEAADRPPAPAAGSPQTEPQPQGQEPRAESKE